VDISEVMIEKSRAFCAGRPNVRTHVTDGTLRPLADGSLDFVFSFIVFQHIPDLAPIRTYVEEASRVLAPGGLFRFQVDGRWRSREGREANTYDGVKLSPGEVRELVAGTGLTILEEWGPETHYHWVAARKNGERAAKVALVPREWDVPVLREMLARCGAGKPEAVAARVVRGEVSLRRALCPAEKGLEHMDEPGFVRTLYRRVWGFDPDPALVESQAGLLSRRVEFREDLLDILLLSAELRNVVRPFLLAEIPWYRLDSPGPPAASIAGTLDTLSRRHASLPSRERVESLFESILGHRPEATSKEFWTRLVDSWPSGYRVLVRRLLAAPPPRLVPAPPPAARRTGLAERIGAAGLVPAAGESFPGEAALARRLLEANDLSDRAFVRRAYEKILGRSADEGGESYWTAKLEKRDLNRPGFLRELLWSDELRAG
jgi:hypothetical protein